MPNDPIDRIETTRYMAHWYRLLSDPHRFKWLDRPQFALELERMEALEADGKPAGDGLLMAAYARLRAARRFDIIDNVLTDHQRRAMDLIAVDVMNVLGVTARGGWHKTGVDIKGLIEHFSGIPTPTGARLEEGGAAS